MKENHFKARKDMIMAILFDPYLARFDYKKRPYLLTDFSKLGFGYNLCQVMILLGSGLHDIGDRSERRQTPTCIHR